ncbi:MAG: hypothetical protein EZS28_031670 [Streblomastix strix]|uniref:Uncharacterized protein n=1 Tax=Streblomastix strix TaxID=222440 RepID=A0A5J4UR43_9EUKA|nr:MAG: hypothetical protein EZS28_031670 [Streblomastix strix]
MMRQTQQFQECVEQGFNPNFELSIINLLIPGQALTIPKYVPQKLVTAERAPPSRLSGQEIAQIDFLTEISTEEQVAQAKRLIRVVLQIQ